MGPAWPGPWWGEVGVCGLRKMSFGRDQPPLALPAADTPPGSGPVEDWGQVQGLEEAEGRAGPGALGGRPNRPFKVPCVHALCLWCAVGQT